MGEVIRILKRSPGRTLIEGPGGTLEIRFETGEDRELFEAQVELLQLVDQQDVSGAAEVVLGLLDRGVIETADEILVTVPIDETARGVVALEVEAVFRNTLDTVRSAIDGAWSPPTE